MFFARIRQWWRHRKQARIARRHPGFASGGIIGNDSRRYAATGPTFTPRGCNVIPPDYSSGFIPPPIFIGPFPGSACPHTDDTRRDDDKPLQVCKMSISEFSSFAGASPSIPDTHCHTSSSDHSSSGSYESSTSSDSSSSYDSGGSSDSGGYSNGE